MQKGVLIAQSGVILLLVGIVVWTRHQRTLKRWWQVWRANPKRKWTLRPRTPDDCQDCRLDAKACAPTVVGSQAPAGTTEDA